MYKGLARCRDQRNRVPTPPGSFSPHDKARRYKTSPPSAAQNSRPKLLVPLLGVGDALEGSLGVLDDLLNGAGVLAGLLLGGIDNGLVLLAGVVHQDASGLGGADAEEQEVDRSEEQVARLDDEAPAGPDQASRGQGGVLRQREVFGRTGEVGGAGENKSPL